jgi:hypothetical protein
MILTKLSDCIKSAHLFDIIFLRNSYGKDCTLFHYNSLGLGNLLMAYAGAHSIIQLTEDKKIIPFPKNRLQSKLVLYKSPLRWFARSEFGLDSPKDLYNRYTLNKQIECSYIDSSVSYIDSKNRVLYLSTHLINEDKDYIKIVAKNISTLRIDKNLKTYFGLNFSSEFNNDFAEGLNIGVHIRRGDFKVSKTNEFELNSSPPIESVASILEVLKNYKISKVTIYSDQSKKLTKSAITEYFPRELTYELFSPLANGSIVLNHMISNHILLQSNSTLSTWSGIISGQISPFIGNKTPWYTDRELNNFIRSDGDFGSELIKIINIQFTQEFH